MDKAVIRLTDAHKIYRMGHTEVLALNGINISFEEGSFWAVMGASGSGKSTLMNILGCLDRLTKGSYELEGKEVASLEDDALSELRLKTFGFVFQSFNLIPQLTVHRNIALPLYYLGVPLSQSQARVEELAARVGLEERLHHLPSELSGGQMQRVAIARALANNPSVLFADEPTGNLDSATANQIMALLQEVHQTGATIIMVTHEEDIAAYASHRLYLKDGVIAKIETNET